MKKYTKINVNITKFDVEDIITSSGLIVDSSELSGTSAEMYEIYQKNSANPSTNVSVFTW